MSKSTLAETSRCWVEIDAEALRHNAGVARQCAGQAGLCAIVKADAYGHGIGLVAPVLAEFVESFGVASLAEARELDQLGLARAIHILPPLLPGERAAAVERGFEITVSDIAELEALAEASGGKPARVWLKADTGMGRAGCCEADLPALVKRARELSVELVGLMTHCPSADEDFEFTFAQLLRWQSLAAQASLGADGPLPRQIANSAALLGYRRPPDQLSRPGLMLYGVAPLAEHQQRLLPVLAWRSRLTLVREVAAGSSVSYGRTWTSERPTVLGTVAAGYADGFRRDFVPGEVLVRGRRCPIRGRVTMDQFVVDLGELAAAGECPQPGEVVTLLGRDGEEELVATELAARAGTIAWEVFTGIGRRVERRLAGRVVD